MLLHYLRPRQAAILNPKLLLFPLVCTVIALFGQPRVAVAQTPKSLELSTGYMYLRDVRTDVDFPNGWTAAFAGKVGPLWAVGQVDASYHTFPLLVSEAHLSVHALMVGGRFSARLGPFVEFGQILVGVVRGRGVVFGSESSDARLGLQPAVGLDYPLTRRLAVRAEFGGRLIKATEETEIRTAAGLVFAFP